MLSIPKSFLNRSRQEVMKLFIIPDELTARTVIINTCGFINDAKEESVDTILKFVKARNQAY